MQVIPPLPKAPIMDDELCARDPVSAVRGLVSARREWFERATSAGCDAIRVGRASSDMIDGAVRALIGRAQRGAAKEGGSAVLALGGYGRREMAPLSDVDLLFLMRDRSSEHSKSVTDSILYPFWDSGVDVGGATRTAADCREVIGHDVRALTAMMDARFIAGSRTLHEEFQGVLEDHFSDASRRKLFFEMKMRERARRLARFGSSIYLTQPNVKEGEGGLRDYHTLMWAAQAARPGADSRKTIEEFLGGRAQLEEVLSSYRFMWGVRYALHLAEGSWNDRLAEGVQEEVATRLGFRAGGGATAAERLMSEYYGRAEVMRAGCERALEMLGREIDPPSVLASLVLRRRLPGGLVKTEHGTLALRGDMSDADPAAAMRLFAASRRIGVPIDPVTKCMLNSDSSWRSGVAEPDSAEALREVFADVGNLDRVLRDMHECGALAASIPEMGRLFHAVQRDGLHSYTVGVHSIRTVGEISALAGMRGKGALPQAMGLVRRPHVLALAAFLHDIGKGLGGDHENRGAKVARAVAERLGYDGRDCKHIEFLVRSHLLMSTLAFKRNIRDSALIERFAQSVRSLELLAMLYIITYADLRAVGPGVWSEWKGGLLSDLYLATCAHLTAGGMSPERRRRDAERVTRAVLRRLSADRDEALLREFLLKLPDRYIFSVPPESIAAHFMMSRELSSKSIATLTREEPERGCTELSVVTRDSPGLFAKIAGVLSAGGANIEGAELHTTSDGTAIDVLWVTDSLHRPFDDPDGWARIRRELAQAVSGERELKQIVEGRFKRRLLNWQADPRPVEVTVDNDVSAEHTVVEISADDRRGLLYVIADTLHELGLSIDLARITTHVDRVTDVFYIRDGSGGKIDTRERLERIKQSLAEALGE